MNQKTLFFLSLHTRQKLDKWVVAFVMVFSVVSVILGVYHFGQSTKKNLLAYFVLFTGLCFVSVSWVLYQKARQYDKSYSVSVLFLIALGVRVIIIFLSPFTNQFVDLSMDQDMGQLLVNGVNPYDFQDSLSLRTQLRLDKRAYTAFTGLSQFNWNYHAGSQLPLLELMMGWIESLYPHPHTYRLVFAWFDALLCVYVFLLVAHKWPYLPTFWGQSFLKKITSSDSTLVYAICIAAIAPILLRSGTLVASFKGSMTLFTLCAIFFSYQKPKSEYLLLSAFFLGFATSFMAISVLALPLILKNLYQTAESPKSFVCALLGYGFIALIGCLVWMIPFYDTLFTMIQNRVTAGINTPIHGSIWRFVSFVMPLHWQLFKQTTILLFLGLNVVGLWKKNMTAEIVTASLFIFFLHLLTIDGSMDRINISLMMCILMGGITLSSVRSVLVSLYFWGGAIIVFLSLAIGFVEKILGKELIEYSFIDGVFNTIFFLTYCFLLAKTSMTKVKVNRIE